MMIAGQVAVVSLVAAAALGFWVALFMGNDRSRRSRRVTGYVAAAVVASLALIKAFDVDAGAAVLVDLVKAIAWPAVVALLLALYRVPVSGLIDRIRTASAKLGGSEFSLSTTIAAVASDVATADATRASDDATAIPDEGPRVASEALAPPIRKTAEVAVQLSDAITETQAAELAGKRVLWVDDKPEGNVNEQRALRRFRIEVGLARTTSSALQRLSDETYDLVITDLNREGNNNEGFVMIEKMRANGATLPVIVYTARRAAIRRRADADAKGIALITGDPLELIEGVIRTLAPVD